MKFFIKDIPYDKQNCSGIYRITNLVNGKIYIGKTVNFRKRYISYKSGYKRQDVKCINEYFLNSINKYGAENFTFSIHELCNEEIASERELYWMKELRTHDVEFGYNLRLDSSTGLIVLDSTRKKISDRVRKEFETGVRNADKIRDFFKDFWMNNPEVKESMKKSVSAAKVSYFLQLTLDDKPIKLWKGINQIIENNSGYKFQNIYAACNGSKGSYMGYKWLRFDYLPDEYLDILVDLDFSYGNATIKQTSGIFSNEYAPHRAKWAYKVSCGDDEYVVLFNGLGLLRDSASCAFSRNKTNEVTTKGFKITREKFNPEIADFDFLKKQEEELQNKFNKTLYKQEKL